MIKTLLKYMAAGVTIVVLLCLLFFLITHLAMYAWNHGPAAWWDGIPPMTDWWQAFWTLIVAGMIFKNSFDFNKAKRHKEIKTLLEALITVQMTNSITQAHSPASGLSLLMRALGVHPEDLGRRPEDDPPAQGGTQTN